MSLLSLPVELVQLVIESTVLAVGIDKAVSLRLVCTLFDNEVQRAIYALPTFETQDAALIPETCPLPYRMGVEMKTRLVMTKIKTKNAANRILCRAINSAVDVLAEVLAQDDASTRHSYARLLAEEAIGYNKLLRIVGYLEPPCNLPEVDR
ncbi:uncharacterized protein BDR25DRAFT_340896, partial [Lindgomyces ingoldianus]